MQMFDAKKAFLQVQVKSKLKLSFISGAGSVLELGSASPRLASPTEPRGGDDVRSGAESADFAPVSSFIRALEETETPRSNVATATKTRQKTSNLRGGAPRSGKEAAFREEQ